MEIKTTEFFKNMKVLPPKDSKDFKDLIEWEEEKCRGGVTVQGIFFSGWLYWHLNHWYIGLDELDKFGNSIIVSGLPELRDNEWERAEAIEACQKSREGYIEIGQRRGAKSESLASILMHSATIFENTQNAIITANKNDQDVIIQKVDFGHKRLWEGLRIDKIDKSWKNSTVRLGFKNKSNEDEVWSTIAIRNADEGRNTEVAAGLTLRMFIIDEIGKFSFGEVVTAAKPTLLSKNGWRSSPLMTGTGGSFEKGEDAERYFYNPKQNFFKGFLDKETSKITGKFFSGEYRMDCKYKSSLDVYLTEVKNQELTPKQRKELSKIEIQISDKEKARETILRDRENKKNDPNRTEYLKEIMYFPLTPDECFMTDGVNMFNEVAAKKQLEYLYSDNKFKGDKCIIKVLSNSEVECEIVTNESIAPISSFPITENESKNGCIVVYEHPIKDAPFGLYVGGVDPYKQDKASYSSSLGAVYIFKRIHDIVSDKFQDMIVAQYVGRPESIDEWCENARALIRYYNALTLAENEDIYFIKYMQMKLDDYLLADEQPWIKSLVPTSTVNRGKGFHAVSKIINYLNLQLKNYTEDVLSVVKNEDTGEIEEKILGFNKILDPMLLLEIAKFRPGGNYDRIRAASAAIALARHLDPYFIVEDDHKKDSRKLSYSERKKKRGEKQINTYSSTAKKTGGSLFNPINKKLFNK